MSGLNALLWTLAIAIGVVIVASILGVINRYRFNRTKGITADDVKILYYDIKADVYKLKQEVDELKKNTSNADKA